MDELPDSIRGQGTILDDLNKRLVDFLECLTDAESHLERLVEQLRMPIKSDLSIGAISKLIELASSISNCGTMRPAWLTAENWTRLRQAASLACSDLHDADTIAATFHDRVPATQLRDLAGCVQNVEELNAAWGFIELNCPLGTPKQFEQVS